MKNNYCNPHIVKSKRYIARMLNILHRKFECNIAKYGFKLVLQNNLS